MELIIKIPDYEYEDLKGLYKLGLDKPAAYKTFIEKTCVEAIANGRLLPEGHGDLIDRNALITELETDYHNSLSESGAHLFVELTNYIDEAETIIESDKESDNGASN